MNKKKIIFSIVIVTVGMITILLSIIFPKQEIKTNIKTEPESTDITEDKSNTTLNNDQEADKEDNQKNKTNYNNDNHVLVQKTHFGERYVFYGSFICTDGFIYKYDNNESNKKQNYDESEQSMIEKSIKINSKLSEEDLNTLKENINNLENNIDLKKNENNNTKIMYFITAYKSSGPVLIKQTGDYEGENMTQEAQEIIRITNKYLN